MNYFAECSSYRFQTPACNSFVLVYFFCCWYEEVFYRYEVLPYAIEILDTSWLRLLNVLVKLVLQPYLKRGPRIFDIFLGSLLGIVTNCLKQPTTFSFYLSYLPLLYSYLVCVSDCSPSLNIFSLICRSHLLFLGKLTYERLVFC